MRLLIRLRADADATYQTAYHHKLRGRLWRALEGTEFDDRHGQNRPIGLCFSNPFPPGPISEGDRRTVLVATTDRDLLDAIASDLTQDREFNIGEMPFTIDEVTGIAPDVGEPGTRGVLESGTGVVVRIPPWRFDDYGIDVDSTEAEFWKPEHSMEPFVTQVGNNIDKKHGLFCPDDLPGPSDVDGDLFDSFELIKTYPLPVTVTEGERRTFILSKWRLGYEVRDDHHRRHLNLALDAGIGERNALGFGFVNVRDKQQPAEVAT